MKSTFKPIKPVRISEEVAQQLKQSILSGNFAAGRLPTEKELAEQFHISRTTTREALRILETAGFIATRQGTSGGAFIMNLTFEVMSNVFLDLFLAQKVSIAELNDLRLLVEPEVARLAAQRVTPEYIARLRAVLEREDARMASDKNTTTSLAGTDLRPEFHFILAEMCGNRAMEGLVRSIINLTRRVVEAVSVGYTHPLGHHGPLLEAIIAGDSEAAAEIMRKHTIANGAVLLTIENLFRQKPGASL